MSKRKCLIIELSCLTVFAIVLSVIFGVGPFYRNPSEAMSQREVTRCFRHNFEHLTIVAGYLETVSRNADFYVVIEDGTPVLRSHPWDEINQIKIEDERVANAIIHLKNQGYSEIRSSHSQGLGGEVRFMRDTRYMARNERFPDTSSWNAWWGHYGGMFQTGVVFLFDDRSPDRTVRWPVPVPLSRLGWYFFTKTPWS